MYKNFSVLAVVPARGGSKGISKKNLSKINNRTLIEWTADVIHQLKYIDIAVLSTDDPDIQKEGLRVGLEVPFRRPPHLALDLTPALDTFIHAWNESEQYYQRKFDLGIWLQPTSFNRQAKHITAACEELINNNWDAVWSLSQTDSKNHPLKQLQRDKNGKIDFYDSNGQSVIARQQLNPLYQQNGAAYVLKRKCILQDKNFFNFNTGSIIIEEPIINIDTEWDLKLAQWLCQTEV